MDMTIILTDYGIMKIQWNSGYKGSVQWVLHQVYCSEEECSFPESKTEMVKVPQIAIKYLLALK